MYTHSKVYDCYLFSFKSLQAEASSSSGPNSSRADSESSEGKMDTDIGTSVELYVYDLTKGMASVMSGTLLGKIFLLFIFLHYHMYEYCI